MQSESVNFRCAALPEPLTLIQHKIIDTLKAARGIFRLGGMTVAEIATSLSRDSVSCNTASVRAALAGLKARGIVRVTGRDGWRMA